MGEVIRILIAWIQHSSQEFQHHTSKLPSMPLDQEYEPPFNEKDTPNHEYGRKASKNKPWHPNHHGAPPDNKYQVEENYRNLGRWRACVILITIEVGIGILSLPSALKTLGLIPGIIAIFFFGALTTYCGYILVQFYRRYPMVTNLVDCAKCVGGRPFEIALGIAFVLNLILICSSANITM